MRIDYGVSTPLIRACVPWNHDGPLHNRTVNQIEAKKEAPVSVEFADRDWWAMDKDSQCSRIGELIARKKS